MNPMVTVGKPLESRPTCEPFRAKQPAVLQAWALQPSRKVIRTFPRFFSSRLGVFNGFPKLIIWFIQ